MNLISDEYHDDADSDRLQLKGLARIIAQIEWLLLLIAVLYLLASKSAVLLQPGLLAGLVAFGAFVVLAHHTRFARTDRRWKLALETWVMVAFITWLLWFTGRVDSPLFNAYLLVIVISALSLGRLATLLEVVMICALSLLLGYASRGAAMFAPAELMGFATRLAPLALAGHLCIMLADHMHLAHGRIRALAERDELTGLYNIRVFYALARREQARATRYARPFAVMMLDADDLKQVNDRYGHEAGNRLIAAFAQTLSRRTRDTDLLARYGGDEFVILLPDTTVDGARRLADRIAAGLAPVAMAAGEEPVGLTVSVGIAVYPRHGASVRELVEHADQAMYRSKHLGKNRVTVFSGDSAEPRPRTGLWR